MAPLFKDFAKDAKDLVEKNYTEVGQWKVESKFSVPDKDVFIAPQVEIVKSKAPQPFDEYVLKVDVGYNVKQYGLKTKTTVSQKAIEPTITYDADGHKVEVAFGKREMTYEFKSGKVAINDKLTEKGINAAVAYEVLKGATVGADADYDFTKKAVTNWSAGAVYADKRFTVAVTTKALKSFVTGVSFPVKISQVPNLKLAVYADCSAADKSKTKITVGSEFGCPLGCAFTFRVKVDNSAKVSLAVIRKFADGWKAALTLDSSFKGFGLNLLRD